MKVILIFTFTSFRVTVSDWLGYNLKNSILLTARLTECQCDWSVECVVCGEDWRDWVSLSVAHGSVWHGGVICWKGKCHVTVRLRVLASVQLKSYAAEDTATHGGVTIVWRFKLQSMRTPLVSNVTCELSARSTGLYGCRINVLAWRHLTWFRFVVR